jgi:mannan endo-1,4-beta-mannosidase
MKNFLIITLFLTSILLSSGIRAQKVEPVNQNTSEEARQLLDILYRIKGKHLLSGQHNYPNELNRSSDTIQAYTGKKPAVWGSSYRGYSKELNTEMTLEAIQKHKNGYIITLMYHQPRPYADSLGNFRNDISDEEWNQLITPGTKIHQTWVEDIDKIAAQLKTLQENEVPVLWRPYHEMNGGWFWWGHRQGEDGYNKLWRMMYDRFTNHHNLNNLIWVWNANAPLERKVPMDYHLYYPGGDVVDILAADIYGGNYKQSYHDDLVELAEGRIIAMGEIGNAPEPEILDQQPQWTWFMMWSRFPWTKNAPGEIKNLYDHPNVITRDELKSDKSGYNVEPKVK